MKPEEIAAVVQGMAPAVREYVSKEMEPLSQKVRGMEEALSRPVEDPVEAASKAAEATVKEFAGAFVKAFNEAEV